MQYDGSYYIEGYKYKKEKISFHVDFSQVKIRFRKRT